MNYINLLQKGKSTPDIMFSLAFVAVISSHRKPGKYLFEQKAAFYPVRELCFALWTQRKFPKNRITVRYILSIYCGCHI